MRDKKLIIADGHHRYETALNYRNERRSAEAQPVGTPRERGSTATMLRSLETEAPPYDLVMMTFVNMNSPGLVILPTHRVVQWSAVVFAGRVCYVRARVLQRRRSRSCRRR